MKKYVFAVMALLLFTLAVYLSIHIYRVISEEPFEESGVPPVPVGDDEIAAENYELVKMSVTLFFERPDNLLLGSEVDEIFKTTSLADRAKQIVIKLIQGPKGKLLPLLPKEALLKGLFLSQEGVAYVDLSGNANALLKGGSFEEVLAIYSIVNSISYNFPEVKKVRILMDGQEKDTFAGHVSLRTAIVPDYDLIDIRPVIDISKDGE